MPSKSPTDETILGYDNVPVSVAASYIGTSSSTLTRSLALGCAPFGYSTPNEECGTFKPNISPGGLVRYKREGLPSLNLSLLEERIADSIEAIVQRRLSDSLKLLLSVGRAEESNFEKVKK